MEEGYIILNESREHRRRKEKKMMVNFFKKGLEYRQFQALTS